jgi:hypothetical protein
MLIYRIKSGILTYNDTVLGIGYSGNANGVNNPDLEASPGIGPIPRTTYLMSAPRDSENTGPFSIPLVPKYPEATFGRTLFRVHGDNRYMNHSASHGCIILPRPVRERMYMLSTDKLLKVI